MRGNVSRAVHRTHVVFMASSIHDGGECAVVVVLVVKGVRKACSEMLCTTLDFR